MISQITPLALRPASRDDVDRGLGMAGADQHPARARDQREDVAGRDQSIGPVRRIDRHRDGPRPVGGADPGRNPVLRLDRDGERGLVAALVGAGHRFEPELVGAVLGHGQADQPAPVAGHEVDRVRGRHLRGDDEIALILAVVVVDEDEHPPVARFVDDRLGPDQYIGRAALDQLFEPHQRLGGRIPFLRAELAQAVGVEPGGAREAGPADLAGGDDRGQSFDQGRAHDSPLSHFSVMKRVVKPPSM